jgi:hypothetical protein
LTRCPSTRQQRVFAATPLVWSIDFAFLRIG